MEFRDKKIQIALAGMRVSFLALFALILSPAIVAAADIQPAEQSLSEVQPVTPHKPYQDTYGPVRNNEGLWEIAGKLRFNFLMTDSDISNTGITVPQMAVALFETNPDAFREHNINGLLTGATLKIPDVKQILKLTKPEAFTLFLKHWESWKKVDDVTAESSEIVIQDVIVKTEDKSEVFEIKSGLISPGHETVAETATKVSREESVINVSNSQLEQQNINNELLDYFTQIQFKLIYKQALRGITKAITWLQHNLTTSSLDSSTPKQLTHPKMIAVFLGLFLFIFLVWLLRRQETDILAIQTSKSNIESAGFSEDKYTKTSNEALIKKYCSDTDKALFNKNLSPLIRESSTADKDSLFTAEGSLPPIVEDSNPNNEVQFTTHTTQDDEKDRDVFSGDIVTNQVEINQFISQDKKTTKRKNKNILEAAFENDISSSHFGFIEETEQPIENINTNPIEMDLLDSMDEIRFVNEKTRHSKIDSFFEATQAENLTDEMLSLDFEKIKSDEKIDIFILEFEEIMSTLASQTPAINDTSNELDNLIQFKSSIHFIKILSEMMQANHLKRFSTTVIEFLEDILVGNTRMTADVTNRLVIVINLYTRYIHSVKESHYYKMKV